MDSGRVRSAIDQPARKTARKTDPPAPGTVLSTSIETARAEANAAAFMTAMMTPTSDGISGIRSMAAKVGAAIKNVASKKSWGTWGFW